MTAEVKSNKIKSVAPRKTKKFNFLSMLAARADAAQIRVPYPTAKPALSYTAPPKPHQSTREKNRRIKQLQAREDKQNKSQFIYTM